MIDGELPWMPAGLDEEGVRCWTAIVPSVREFGLLTPDTRPDIEWLARLHSRIVVLTERTADCTPEVGQDPDSLQHAALLREFRRLAYRYGLTPSGRREMEQRGRPGTPNLLPEDMLEEGETS